MEDKSFVLKFWIHSEKYNDMEFYDQAIVADTRRTAVLKFLLQKPYINIISAYSAVKKVRECNWIKS